MQTLTKAKAPQNLKKPKNNVFQKGLIIDKKQRKKMEFWEGRQKENKQKTE